MNHDFNAQSYDFESFFYRKISLNWRWLIIKDTF